MSRSMYRGVLAVAVGLFSIVGVASLASAAELSYQFNPTLSLVGNCTTSAIDPVPDPSCPYPPPPDRPSGRFAEPRSIAIDAYGNEYVASYAGNAEKGRIDVFDDEGKFITELADPFGPFSVAVDTKGNLYVFEQAPGNPSEVVRYTPTVYEPEAGNITYGNPRVLVDKNELSTNGLAIDFSNDHLYVAQNGVIREYGSAAEENKLLNTISPAGLSSSAWVAVDSQRRRLYASSCRQSGILDCVIRVFEADAPYAELEEIDGSTVPAGKFVSTKGWLSVAVDEESGSFFVDDLELSNNVYQFDENYEYVSTLNFPAFQGGNALQIGFSNSPLNPTAPNKGFLFVPVVEASGRALAFEPPAACAPEIEAFGTANIAETEAELRATIDPCFADTDYTFEYVSQAGFEESGFENALIASEGTVPGTSLATQVGASISGLAPGVSYRFRILATNEVGGDEREAGFATYPVPPVVDNSCPNQSLRIGSSAALPDCRAYELVTPADTNGRPPGAAGTESDRFGSVVTSPSGTAISFEIIGGALPGSEGTGGFHGDRYRSSRGPSGWGSELTGPTGTEASKPEPGGTSPDQGYGFWVASGEGSAVIEGERPRYVRYPDGRSELIGRGSIATDPNASGTLITENGTHIVFQTGAVPGEPIQLEPNAPPTGTRAVYDRTADEVTHVVSLLPGDETPAAGEDANYLNASADGNGIAFEIGNTLYLRKDNAVTYEIGTGVTFAGVSEGGERIFYVEGGDLLAFDTETEAVVPFSQTGDVTPVNVAPGGIRAYFVSPSVLGEENPNGDLAQAGEENLYLSEEGQISFVGTVTEDDVKGEVLGNGAHANGLGLWTEALASRTPAADPSRLTSDGRVLLFQAEAELDGQVTGGVAQIYRFDSVASRLRCLSCNPTRIPEGGGASLLSYRTTDDREPPFAFTGYVANLSASGRRAFFESDEALVSGDTDGVRDVYEWEEQGVGSCKQAGGCVYLISSGHSSNGSFLYGTSSSGDDVFFTTVDTLTGFDAGGTVSIYDARVNGGFPEPASEPCQEAEPCRGAGSPGPSIPTPTSEGLGRVAESKPRNPKVCPKGKRKVKRNGKVRCVKKHRKHHQRKASTKQKGATK